MKKTKRQKNQVTPQVKYFKDLLTRKIYEVPVSKLKEYGFYRNRYTISIMLGVLLNNFKLGNTVILGITLALIALMEFRYRSAFLPKLKVCHHINVDRKISKEAHYMNIGLYFVLAILLFAYGLTGDVESYLKWILIALGVGSGGLAAMYLNELLVLK